MTTAGKTAISTPCIYIFGAHKLKNPVCGHSAVLWVTLHDPISAAVADWAKASQISQDCRHV